MAKKGSLDIADLLDAAREKNPHLGDVLLLAGIAPRCPDRADEIRKAAGALPEKPGEEAIENFEPPPPCFGNDGRGR